MISYSLIIDNNFFKVLYRCRTSHIFDDKEYVKIDKTLQMFCVVAFSTILKLRRYGEAFAVRYAWNT